MCFYFLNLHKLNLSRIFQSGLLGLGLMVFCSCADPEHPMPPIPEASQESITIDVENLAAHYYNLANRKIVKSNRIVDWDLKFCNGAAKFQIFLNTTKNMNISRYQGKFSDAINLKDLTRWETDVLVNEKMESALGNWGDFAFTDPKSFGYTYVIDLGYLRIQNEFGYRKMEVLGFSNHRYLIRYGTLDDPVGDTVSILKSDNAHYSYLSFNDKAKQVQIEPDIHSWDILFTQYGMTKVSKRQNQTNDTTFSWEDMILLNTNGRTIACDSTLKFDEITFWDAEAYHYSSKQFFIGSSWRFLNANHDWEISKFPLYVIKTQGNFLYKIELNSLSKSDPTKTVIGFRIKNL